MLIVSACQILKHPHLDARLSGWCAIRPSASGALANGLRDRGWVVFISGAVSWFGIGQAALHYKSWQVAPFACLAGIGLAMCIAVFRPDPRRDTVFYGIRRDARKSFWQRKRNDILAKLIAAVMGAVQGVGGTLPTQALNR